jgi:multidrug transporter EmrE-like cation transporter
VTLTTFTLIIFAVLLVAAVQLAVKMSVRETGGIELSSSRVVTVARHLPGEPRKWLRLCCYGISVTVWILALSRVDVSIACPLLSIGYLDNAFAAYALMGESLAPGKLMGIGGMVVGATVLVRS